MKTLIRNIIICILTVLIIFSLTGCKKKEVNVTVEAENKTKEIQLNYSDKFNISCEVLVEKTENGEEKTQYVFSDDKPEFVEYERGNKYLVGDDIVFIFETDQYTYHTNVKYKDTYGESTPSFENMKKYINSDEYEGTVDKSEPVKISGRDAIKYDYKYGNGEGELHGYSYLINIDDLTDSKSYMKITVITSEVLDEKGIKSFNTKIGEIFNTLKIEEKESL